MNNEESKKQGRIGILIEDHFDETEFRGFNDYFPAQGYEVEYISHLWGNKQITFKSNDFTEHVVVSVELNDLEPINYDGIILIGAYAMDRLRYEANPREGQPNQSPAVKFLRAAVRSMDSEKLTIGTICHSLWLFCAAPELLQGRDVTCAHNLISDVNNAGGNVLFEGDATKGIHVDGNLVTAKHPSFTYDFMKVFIEAIAKQKSVKVAA
jgi:protease I